MFARKGSRRAPGLVLLLAMLVTARIGIAQPPTSPNFTLEASAFSTAAGDAASETFAVVASVGEASAVGHAASANFAIDSGFLGSTPACTGDCNGDGQVTVDELLIGISIGLGVLPFASCPAFEVVDDGDVTVDELVQALTNALIGCTASRIGNARALQVDSVPSGRGAADLPQTITYQGRLTGEGMPITGTLSMSFAIYDHIGRQRSD